jgi:hypothetical protein
MQEDKFDDFGVYKRMAGRRTKYNSGRKRGIKRKGKGATERGESVQGT